MNTLKNLLKQPLTYVGIVTAIAFQLIFFSVWMTAYDGVEKRFDQLAISIVNNDADLGKSVTKGLVNDLPFKTSEEKHLKQALSKMNNRQIEMVIYIPAKFNETLKQTGKAEIKFYINQATASLGKQAMEATAKQITQQLNTNILTKKLEILPVQLDKELSKALPKELTPQIIKTIETQLQNSTSSITPVIKKTNNVEGFKTTMVPMMIVLASFVGAMIMSMQINEASLNLKNANKWSLYASRQFINLTVALLLSLITPELMSMFNIQLQTSILTAMVFQTLVFFAFLSIAQMFLYLFGKGGMLLNILLLSLQLVTSGVIVPRTMLSVFYYDFSSLLPATYAADGYFTLIFGGDSLNNNLFSLCFVVIVSQLAAITVVLSKRSNKYGSTKAIVEQ